METTIYLLLFWITIQAAGLQSAWRKIYELERRINERCRKE